MIPLNIKPPANISMTAKYTTHPARAEECYHLEKDPSVSDEEYDIFFEKIMSVYDGDFKWETRSDKKDCFNFILNNYYSAKYHALKEYGFPGCPRGIYISLKNFTFYTDDLINMTNIDIFNIGFDPKKYIHEYQNLDLFEKDLRRWSPPNIDEYLYDIECLRCFSKYRLGYRQNITNIYDDVRSYMRIDRINDLGNDTSEFYLDGSLSV